MEPTKVLTETIYGTATQEKDKVKTSMALILDCKTDWISTTYTYDVHGRLSRSSGNNHLNGTAGSEQVSYTYDYLDRLLTTQYTDLADNASGTVAFNNRYTENVTYADKRGNISALTRNGLYPSGSCWTSAHPDW